MRRIPLLAWFAALFALNTGLSFVPGLPVHGWGQVWWLLPVLFWFRNPRHRKRILLYLGAILLQFLAYPAPDLGFLGWTLLLPYLAARELDDGASWWRAAMLFGFLRAHFGFFWLGYIHFTAWWGVSVASAIAFTFTFEAGMRYLRFLPFALRAGTCWVAFEWVHSWFFGGFPWLFLSHSQYRYPLVIQIADLGGAVGLSFLMAFVQAAAYHAVRTLRFRREAFAAGLLAALTLAYGATRSGPPPSAEDPGVLMVQSSYPHAVKANRLVTREEQWRTLHDLTRDGLRAHPDTALVVWPETMYPWAILDDAARVPNAPRLGRPALYGINTFRSETDARGYNAAALVDREGAVLGIYRKQRLVSMGEEFLPRRVLPEAWCDAWFDWLAVNLGYPRSCDLRAGEGYEILDAGPRLKCAVLICFEGLYPSMARRAVREGEADFLLHLVNNGWFGPGRSMDSAVWQYEPRQAVASWVFRAVETRAPFLSCANAGVTCAVAPDGRITASTDVVATDAFLYARVPPRWETPLFVRGGHLLPPAVLIALGLAFLVRSRLERSETKVKTGA